MNIQRPEAGHTEAIQLLLNLFGNEEATMAQLAPEGWENSPYYRLQHPTVDQLYLESIDFHNNANQLLKKDESPPTREEIEADYEERLCHPRDELLQLLGECVWNIFSNNHSVIGPEGEEYNLGSFRGSGRFIADFINRHYPSDRIAYDYLDFYCAGWAHHDRADLTPVYALLFQRLRERFCDWVYSFPRTYLIDLGQKKEDVSDDTERYNPEEAMRKDLERKERQKEVDDFRRELEEGYEEAKEEAKYELPPAIIRAYREVYGKWPEGWVH